jgi:hypothetical protein
MARPVIARREVRFRGRLRALALAALAAGALSVSSVAHADPTPEQVAGARAAATEGNKAYAEKRYKDALDLFQRAESLMHAPTHVLMTARSQVQLGQLVAGRESYRSLTHETLAPKAPQAFRDAQESAKKELEALEPRVPTIDVKLSDPSAEGVVVTMDGAELASALVGIARPVDPGDHKISARGTVVAADEKSVHVDEGAHLEVVLTLHAAPKLGGDDTPPPPHGAPAAPPPAEPDRTLAYVGYAGLGVGGAGLIVGGVFMGLGFAKHGEANDAYTACGETACVAGSSAQKAVDDLDSDAQTKATVGIISLAAGGAIAVTGLILVLVAPSGDAVEPSQAALMPYVGPGEIGLRGTF